MSKGSQSLHFSVIYSWYVYRIAPEKKIERWRGNTGEKYEKLRLIYEDICRNNDRLILLPNANNFFHYQEHALTLQI